MGFGEQILKNIYESRNGHFWTQTTQIQKFQLSFVVVLFLLFQQQEHKNALKPHFYSVLAKSKTRDFSKNQLKRQKIEKPIICTLFLKMAIFRKLPDNWPKRQKHSIITERAKTLKPLSI